MDDFDKLLAEIRRCRLCVEAPLTMPLPHAPRPVLQASPAARLLIVGQAPGARVHGSGLPFDDPSGDRLRGWLGIGRELFYDRRKLAVIPMGFCFPGYDAKGSDLPPRRECAARWRVRLMGELPLIETIVCLGSHAQKWHMPRFCRATLTETVRHWRESFQAAAPRVLPLPHPSWRNSAWLKKNPWLEAEILPVLRQEVARLTA